MGSIYTFRLPEFGFANSTMSPVPWPTSPISYFEVVDRTTTPEQVEKITKDLEKKGKKSLANKVKSDEAKKKQLEKFLDASRSRKK